ncbi:unnamed protein product [Eruca vesicaria subsp. sativa]|uniref:Uncharacterized protein n=1 Tax=Eruca vesicaria subsp. sativa TaxID=29727 RepID=A0ABC8KT26_ERUVS|nr:unnamed protein product [Eruca vesicaria subsp. sativa]
MNPMFYFLLALTTVLAATASEPVLDTDGNIMVIGGSYYVIPPLFEPLGGGLTLAPRGGNQCPLYVGEEYSYSKRGIPARFSNWKSRVGFVPEAENLNIEMDVKSTICAQSTYWWLNNNLLVVGGPKPQQDSRRSFFQIRRNKGIIDAYTISYCSVHSCLDVGITNDQYGVRSLTLGSIPFPVVFMKANGTETMTSSKTMSII